MAPSSTLSAPRKALLSFCRSGTGGLHRCEQSCDCGTNGVNAEGLEDALGSAEILDGRSKHGFAIPGQDEDREKEASPTNRADEIEARGPRKIQIRGQERIAMLQEKRQCSLGILSGVDLKAIMGQQVGEQRADHRIVIDDEDPGARLRAWGHVFLFSLWERLDRQDVRRVAVSPGRRTYPRIRRMEVKENSARV